MNDKENDFSVLIPLIRKIVPTLLAQDIVGVQSMSDIFAEGSKITTGEDFEKEYPYWVLIDHTFWSTAAARERNDEIYNWVEQTFGPKLSSEWATKRWQASNRKYYFKNESDRTMFVMKWS